VFNQGTSVAIRNVEALLIRLNGPKGLGAFALDKRTSLKLLNDRRNEDIDRALPGATNPDLRNV
jgi:hypothetical protein